MKRYSKTAKIKSPSGKTIYSTTRYPSIPVLVNDIYVVTTIGDRFDTLAAEYYGNSSLWWIISRANSFISQDSLTPPIGKQIRIPQGIVPIISNFEKLNESNTLISNNNTLPQSGGSSY
jgi:hypothetical protein